MEAKTEGSCGRCGYHGDVWPGRYGGQRCWLCYAVQHGHPPEPSHPDNEAFSARLREAFNVPEPQPPPPDPWAFFKYNGRLAD